MTTAVLIDAVRTAGGKRNGALSGWHPADLAAETLKAITERNNLDPALIDDVIMGCVSQVGGQALNVGRNAVLAAGFPESVPATTIDRQCGSSQQAAHFAAQGVMSGAYDIAIAAGVEVMTLVPMGASVGNGKSGFPFGEAMGLRYAERGGLVPQGISAEMIAEKWGLTRDELDAFSLESQRRAAQAIAEGRFDNEIVPVRKKVLDKESREVRVLDEMHTIDEGVRESSLEGLGRLKPSFKEDGLVHAGNSSQLCDGASAALIMSEDKANELGLTALGGRSLGLEGLDAGGLLLGRRSGRVDELADEARAHAVELDAMLMLDLAAVLLEVEDESASGEHEAVAVLE